MAGSRVAVLGCGNMISAIFEGARPFLARSATQCYTFTPSRTRAERLAGAIGGRAVPRLEDVPPSDIYFVGCKPQQFGELAAQLRGDMHDLQEAGVTPTVVSVMAGITADQISAALGTPAVIRAMPNTPVKLQKGVTLMYSTPDTAEHRGRYVDNLFGACGQVVTVKRENDLEYLTGISGCGPAFFFEYALSFVKPLMERGYDAEMAADIVLRTFEGACALAIDSHGDESLATLRDRVTSKGGVTAEALNVMREKGVPAVGAAMLTRAFDKNRELSKLMSLPSDDGAKTAAAAAAAAAATVAASQAATSSAAAAAAATVLASETATAATAAKASLN